MDPPNKRLKQSPSSKEESGDFISFGDDDDGEETKAAEYGYNAPTSSPPNTNISTAPREPRAMRSHPTSHSRNARNDPRNAKDRPKSKHALPGYEPWVLVKTKFGRRFAHNTASGESFWYIPADVMPGVREFEQREREGKEKAANAKWAEEQLQEMRGSSKAVGLVDAASEGLGNSQRERRRRSESLQREDEAAMLAELAAEAERAEEKDVMEVVEKVEPLKPRIVQGGDGYGSESSYEEVEVTDSEFEDDEDAEKPPSRQGDADGDPSISNQRQQQQDDGPVEFGEDDIAYQLAAMEGAYSRDAENDDEFDEYEEDLDDPDLGATNIFREMLDDHKISPFTPWESLLSDTSATSIIMDDRYTVLPTTHARKQVWESWVKDTAARLKVERAAMEVLDPKIPYLEFLAQNASVKLYWPEFKRKFKKEAVMNERKLAEKEREKMYREHVARLKLPETTRKADLIALLKTIPLGVLNKSTTVGALPQQVRGHVHFISLPAKVRDKVIETHIASLPSAPASASAADGDSRAEEDAKRQERRRQEAALKERKRKVEEERRKADKEERWAKRDLREEERELRKAMEVGRRGAGGLLE